MSDSIGARLREAREARGMSLRALASTIGVSPSLLSQVETGKTKPSVSTLYALVSELDISTDALLGRGEHSAAAVPPRPASIAPSANRFRYQSSADNPVLEMENGVRWEKLAVLDGIDVEALRVTYQPGASSSIEGHLMRHFGIEHVYMLSGELSVQLEFDTHSIPAGDSMVFDSQRPHLFVNRGTEPAIGLWYIVGRQAASLGAPAGAEEVLRPAGSGRGGAEPVKSAIDVLRTFRD